MRASGDGVSATNRGAERHSADFYETPFDAVEPIAHLLPRVACIVDAGCGSGAIGRHLAKLGVVAHRLVGVDIEDRFGDTLKPYDEVRVADWLKWDGLPDEPSGLMGQLIVANPPFNLARPFIDYARRLVGPTGHVWMLLRQGFASSRKRRAWWQVNPADQHVLSHRPSFCWTHTYKVVCGTCGAKWKHRESVPVGTERVAHPSLFAGLSEDACEHIGHHLIDKATTSTSDAADYAWFAFGPGPRGRWAVL